MAMGLFRVCLVVVTAIINHPLLFPRENATIPENEEEILRKMQEHQEKLELEQMRLEEEMSRLAAEKEALQVEEEGQRQPEAHTAWDLWSTLCMILFLIIEVWRQDHQDGPLPECLGGDEDELSGLGVTPLQGLPLPNKATLDHFYDHCIRSAAGDTTRTREFVEGFVDDLLEALRSVCNRNTDMEMLDFIGVGSMYENWQVERPLLCRLFVPFIPPEPYSFHPEFWCSSPSMPLDRKGYGQIKVTLADGDPLGCICGKTKLGEDMLCLLHGDHSGVRPSGGGGSGEMEDLLCSRESSYLDAMQVMKWFQVALTRAWHRIAHKYEFDLAFGQLDTPGSLKIKFRSGKFMPFILTPAIQYNDSDLFFVSHLPRDPCGGTTASSTDWLLSFAVYERQFLRMTAKALPEGACHLSCLQIATFLLSKQNRLTGPSGLSSYHLKTALLHLLLSRRAADWKATHLDARLRELFCFLERSLLEKKLHHFFVGNRKVPEAMGLPEAVRRAEPLNLFRPFVLQRTLYRSTVDSFYEMLRNAPTLISEYSLHVPSDRASPPPKAIAV